VDKAITTALLIVAGVVCMIFVFNSVYPMINRSSDAMVSMAEQVDERMKSRINIVHAANNSTRTEVYLWIKNIGTQRIVNVEASDLFFGEEDNFDRVPYYTDAGETYPRWIFELENDTAWETSATIKVTITYSSDPGAGTYFSKFIIPNGISDDYYFSM
jgi:archaellum component FlaF (FlaF/FlaG flagellin family)